MVSYYRAFAPKSEAVNYMDYRATLRDLHTFSSFQASKVATREFRFLSFRDICSDTFVREASAQIGEGL